MTLLPTLVLLVLPAPAFGAWSSTLVFYDNGALTYADDGSGHELPDFSYVGYDHGESAFPTGTVRASLTTGATAAQIATALATAAAAGTLGDPGVVSLGAGTYTLTGSQQVLLNASHVILRGAGSGSDPASNTIISRTGTNQANVIVIGGTGSTFWTASTGSATNITDTVVALRSRSFTVTSTAGFAEGDDVLIRHPATTAWLTAMDFGGVPAGSTAWSTGKDIHYKRRITDITGSVVTVDSPFYMELVKATSQCDMIKFSNTGRIQNIGLENLRVTIAAASETDEAHAKSAVELKHADNVWCDNVVVEGFWYAGFHASNGLSQYTIQDCQAIEPRSLITGSRRYNFVYEYVQQGLYRNCTAGESRHAFLANGGGTDNPCVATGIVVLDCIADVPTSAAGGHAHLAQGCLYDRLTVNSDASFQTEHLALANNGNAGGAGNTHGWGDINGVIWNSTITGPTNEVIVQEPPLGNNFAIGVQGGAVSKTDASGSLSFGRGVPSTNNVATIVEGWIEGTDVIGLSPDSLYLAQLEDRTETGPEWTADAASVDFGYAITTTTTDRVITLTNVSGGTLSATVTENSAHYSIQSGGTITDLADQATHAVTVRYTPTTAAQHTAILSVSGDATVAVALTGVACTLQAGLAFNADAGTLISPIVDGGSFISQPSSTSSPGTGGIAVYGVTLADAGTYKVATTVNAPNTSQNSYFVEWNVEPGNENIWDIISLTSGTQARDVSARGETGTFDAPQFDPQTWNLSAGNHILVVRGREPTVNLATITVTLLSEPETPSTSPGRSGRSGGPFRP